MIRDTFSDDVPRLRRSPLSPFSTQRLRAGLTSRRAYGAGNQLRCNPDDATRPSPDNGDGAPKGGRKGRQKPKFSGPHGQARHYPAVSRVIRAQALANLPILRSSHASR